jgi:hypothetical protein
MPLAAQWLNYPTPGIPRLPDGSANLAAMGSHSEDAGVRDRRHRRNPSLAGSRVMQEWMKSKGFPLEYMEVEADHGRMVPLVLPAVFDFFDRQRKK